MKKMVFMAAFVAATAAFVACSSNDDLVQQKPEISEASEDNVEEKVPMTIVVSDLTSRGTDFNDTDHPLTAFTLYSNMNASWVNGKPFTKPNDSWTVDGADLSWENGGPFTFYGVSDVTNLTKVTVGTQSVPQTPTVSENTVSFGYTMPQELRPKDDPDDEQEADRYWCNSENLPDLLVSKNTGSSSLNDGKLTVDFTHALARIKEINIYANTTRLEALETPITDHQMFRFRINGIRLGGLKSVGTYTFGATTPWTVSGDDTEFTIPLKQSELTYAKTWFKPGADKTTGITLPLTDGGLYLIPQTAAGEIVGTGSYEVSGAYAELDAQVFVYDNAAYTTLDDIGWYYCCEDFDPQTFKEADSEQAKFGLIRVPLKFTLAANNVYILTLDLSRGVYVGGMHDGEKIFDSVNFDPGT